MERSVLCFPCVKDVLYVLEHWEKATGTSRIRCFSQSLTPTSSDQAVYARDDLAYEPTEVSRAFGKVDRVKAVVFHSV